MDYGNGIRLCKLTNTGRHNMDWIKDACALLALLAFFGVLLVILGG